jgi:hypothetical protein
VLRKGECYTLTVGYCMDKRIGNTEAPDIEIQRSFRTAITTVYIA